MRQLGMTTAGPGGVRGSKLADLGRFGGRNRPKVRGAHLLDKGLAGKCKPVGS